MKKSVRLCSACGSSKSPAEIARPGPRVALRVLKLRGPDSLLDIGDRGADRRPVTAEPLPEWVVSGKRPVGNLVCAAGIDPVETGMVEDDVENDANAVLVRGVDEFDEVAPRAEPRVDVQEMLDAVAVECVEVATLLEHRAQPDGRDAEFLQVVELGLHALDGPMSRSPGGRAFILRRPTGGTRSLYFLLVDRFSDGQEASRPLLDRSDRGAARPHCCDRPIAARFWIIILISARVGLGATKIHQSKLKRLYNE